jgi:anthranilate synthase component 1
MNITTICKTVAGDLTSPIAVYLRLRDRYSHTMLLESGDFSGADDCRSFIGCDPIAEIQVNNGELSLYEQGKLIATRRIAPEVGLSDEISRFLNSFVRESAPLPKGVVNGAFGYLGWDSIQYAERITFTQERDDTYAIPEVRFFVFRYILAFNHFRKEVHVLENCIGDEQRSEISKEFLHTALEAPIKTHPFAAVGPEESVVTDEKFLEMVRTCKRHIARGDVFQIVPSRRYLQGFEGDDFQVYRALRSINPSPYLFYADFGSYRLIGSSPEAQILVQNGTAAIYPIAGTTPRSGDDTVDRKRAEELLEDEKENAEHCMLVDLARNDLSRHCKNVRVRKFRELQYFSHVIHIVSEVCGDFPSTTPAVQIVSDTFPAGTLSGAPKHSAMTILDQVEPIRRGHYGGAIGFFGFNGDAVFGIMIRSFLSIHNRLVYQAGMGVVADSIPEKELNEAHAKLGAPRASIKRAQELS